MSRTICDENVFKYGTVVAVLDMTGDQAETHCLNETIRLGYVHDWHYVGGRVTVKALPNGVPDSAQDKLGRLIEAVEEHISWAGQVVDCDPLTTLLEEFKNA